MASTPVEIATENIKRSSCAAAVKAVRQASHLAHDASMLKTKAADAVEDGLHAARRAVTRGLRGAEDMRDKAAYRIKRAPFATVALALGVGLLAGMTAAWGFKNRRA